MSEALNSPQAKRRRFRSYSKYKNSGVEWIDNIPINWSVCPLFTVAREREEINIGNIVQNVLSLSYGKIIDRDVSDNFGLLPDSFETYQIVHEGNIILRLTDLQNDKRSLRVGLVNHPGIITSAYICLKLFRDIEPSYGYYLLHAYDITKVFYSFGGGVRQTMKFEDLKWLPILKPSHDEQHNIAGFLDRETGKIDALIEKKERLIELLQEKRTALITQAVTKGLDSNVPMKDSGVEWLGKIPAHWEAKKIKFTSTLLNGYAFDSNSYADNGIPVIRIGDVGEEIDWDNVKRVPVNALNNLLRFQILNGDVLLAMTGATIGKSSVYLSNEVALLNQ
jgi:type I restriction enzyme S subunit